ncbi:MAG TPA: type II CAAX endopeptidase family protein [Thermoplasmata archaeon]|nr:type II CAAX endopeptidase family protein [Thermoplasmata archaeon]
MATETVHAAPPLPPPRWAIGAIYLGLIVLAEILIAVPDPSKSGVYPYQQYGLTIHILLVFALLFHSVTIQEKDTELSLFLMALSLAPLIRIFSLSMPRFWGAEPIHTLPWLAVVGIPLLTAAGAVAYVQQLPPWLLGLGFRSWREMALQFTIGLTGIPLGLIEYTILRQYPWISGDTIVPVLAGGVVIFFSTGLAEEVIFRGILLRRAMEMLGNRTGILFVTLVFSAMHIFFLNGYDLTFVFFVGLFFALVVVKTKSLWGAIMSHTLGNVVLYLIAPFLLASWLPPLRP